MTTYSDSSTPLPIATRAPFRIGEWQVYPQLLRLQRNEEVVQLGPRLIQLLLRLTDSAGEVVPREELLNSIWGDAAISEEGLTVAVSELRKALVDDRRQPQYVETIRGIGYRLVAPVNMIAEDLEIKDQSSEASPTSRIDEFITANHGVPESRFPLSMSLLLAMVCMVVVIVFAVRNHKVAATVRETVPLTTLPGSEIHPAVAPDGQHVVFAWSEKSGGNTHIYVTTEGADSPIRLTYGDNNDNYPAWSPNGRRIVFARTTFNAASDAIESTICVVSAEGGEPHRLISTHGAIRGLSYAPNGRSLAYAAASVPGGPTFLWLLDLGTLASAPLPVASEAQFAQNPHFSPDGDQIAFIGGSRMLHNIFVYSIVEESLTRITVNQRRIAGLDWGPNGESILFSAAPSGLYQLWQVGLADGEIIRLDTSGSEAVYPATGRGSDVIVYQRSDVDIDVWQVNLDASPDSEPSANLIVASTRIDCEPDLSPSGDHLVFISARTGHREVWVSDVAGQGPRRLTNFNGSFITRPRWSTDGQRIAFTAIGGNGVPRIYIANVDEGKPELISFNSNHQSSHQYFSRWSGDGKHLYYYKGGDLYVANQTDGARSLLLWDGSHLVGETADLDLIVEHGDGSGLYVYSAATGEEELLLERDPHNPWSETCVVGNKLFLLTIFQGAARLSSFDLQSRIIDQVWPLPFQPGDVLSNIVVSSDCTRLFLDRQVGIEQADLMMVRED